jgi:hypothetical protein
MGKFQTVGYLVTSLFIARQGEIKAIDKVMQTISLLIVSTAVKLFILKPITSYLAEQMRLMEKESVLNENQLSPSIQTY